MNLETMEPGVTMVDTDVPLPPRCCLEVCAVPLVLRDPPGGLTPEQAWCGVWWDHPPASDRSVVGHTSSLLVASAELRAELGRQAAVTAGR